MSGNTSFNADMERLRQRFVARARDNLPVLSGQSGAPVSAQELRELIHRMAGSAGLFGYKTVSTLAKDAETELLESGSAPTLAKLIGELETIVSKEK